MRILFICTHNRCRSILAEAITNKLARGRIVAASAGSAPAGAVHPLSLKYLAERGFETTGLASHSWDDYDQFEPTAVVTLCESAAAESCPSFFGPAIKVHWGLKDPSKEQGSEQANAAAFNHTIDIISERINTLLSVEFENLDGHALADLLNSLS